MNDHVTRLRTAPAPSAAEPGALPGSLQDGEPEICETAPLSPSPEISPANPDWQLSRRITVDLIFGCALLAC